MPQKMKRKRRPPTPTAVNTRRVARIVGRHVMREMTKFIGAYEQLVRQNEQLMARIGGLEEFLAEHHIQGMQMVGAGAVVPDDYFDVEPGHKRDRTLN